MKKNPKLRDANDQSHELEDIPDESEDALSVFVNKKVLQKGVKKVSTFNTQ